MNVPILTGGRQKGDETVARADVTQAQLQQKQVQELAALDTRSAWAELVAARAAWESSAGTVQQATRAYEIADVRFRNGVSTQLELSDSRLLLQQAEANRALAARDLQVARARVALLPELPLGASPRVRHGPPSGRARSRRRRRNSSSREGVSSQARPRRGSRRRGPGSHDALQGSHRKSGHHRAAGTTGLARASWPRCLPRPGARPKRRRRPRRRLRRGTDRQENVVSVTPGTIVVGPILSGELRAQREATIRAELGGSMLEVRAEEGQSVAAVRCSGRIEPVPSTTPASRRRSAVRNAESQLAVARREVERTEQLVKAGAIAARDLDLAQANVTAVEAQLADAKPAGQRPAPARRRRDYAPDRRPHLEEGRQPRRRGQPRHRALHRDRPVVDAARSRRALRRTCRS
jgi:hypothetical protein